VCFVPLAALESAELLPTAIAEALGLTLQGRESPKQQLLAHLHEHELLLVLDNFEQLLDGAHGILVPGGFGDRGTRGMMRAAEIAREREVPYFGICYGFQWAAVEYARHVCGLADADSTECAPDTKTNVIYKLRELRGIDELGGTMRLGAWICKLTPGSLASSIYGGATEISERHRHRYEFNREYEAVLTGAGLRISGTTPDGTYVEIVELDNHPHFIGCQFHPEFKSKPLEPQPLFSRFVKAAYEDGQKRRQSRDRQEHEMFHRPEKVRR